MATAIKITYFNMSGPAKFSESVITLRKPAAIKDSPYVWHMARNSDGFGVDRSVVVFGVCKSSFIRA